MASYMVPVLQVHLTLSLLFGKCFQYALQNLACSRSFFHSRHFLCVNCLFFRWSAFKYLEAGDICQYSSLFDCQNTNWSYFQEPFRSWWHLSIFIFIWLSEHQVIIFSPTSSKDLTTSLTLSATTDRLLSSP